MLLDGVGDGCFTLPAGSLRPGCGDKPVGLR
jgi:hypothetical protein